MACPPHVPALPEKPSLNTVARKSPSAVAVASIVIVANAPDGSVAETTAENEPADSGVKDQIDPDTAPTPLSIEYVSGSPSASEK